MVFADLLIHLFTSKILLHACFSTRPWFTLQRTRQVSATQHFSMSLEEGVVCITDEAA